MVVVGVDGVLVHAEGSGDLQVVGVRNEVDLDLGLEGGVEQLGPDYAEVVGCPYSCF